jgi:phage tail tape-measure protein
VIDGFLQDGSIEDPLYDQLEQAMAEAENSRFEASEEAVRCAKEERDVVEAIRKVYFRSQTTFLPHPLKGR